MPPKEITKTRLSAATVAIESPRANASARNPVKISGIAVVTMKMTERIGGGAPQVSEFPVTEKARFKVTVRAGLEELPAVLATAKGKITWRLTRPPRLNLGENLITATLRGSVDEIDTEVDLPTGKVLVNRSRPKGVNQSHSIAIRVHL